MKIVIEIPTGMYEDIRNGKNGFNNFICTAIRNGAPLTNLEKKYLTQKKKECIIKS